MGKVPKKRGERKKKKVIQKANIKLFSVWEEVLLVKSSSSKERVGFMP